MYTAEAALGVYLRERLSAAQALCRLLSLQLLNGGPPPGGEPDGGDAPPPPLLAAVIGFNADLLGAREAAPGGPAGAQRNALIGSITDALQVRAAAASAAFCLLCL